MTKGEIAERLFREGCNCSQAVVLAFADELGLDKKTLYCLSSSFGGGMGKLREVCGAVSGMAMVAGMKYGYYEPNDNEKKSGNYAQLQMLADIFRKENGSIVCRELLGLSKKADSPMPEKRTDEYYKKRPCAELVHMAADILEKNLFEVSK